MVDTELSVVQRGDGRLNNVRIAGAAAEVHGEVAGKRMELTQARICAAGLQKGDDARVRPSRREGLVTFALPPPDPYQLLPPGLDRSGRPATVDCHQIGEVGLRRQGPVPRMGGIVNAHHHSLALRRRLGDGSAGQGRCAVTLRGERSGFPETGQPRVMAVRGEGGAADGSGFLLLAALFFLQLPRAFVFDVGGELVPDDGVGRRVVAAATGREQLDDAVPLTDFGGPRSSSARPSRSRSRCCCSRASSSADAAAASLAVAVAVAVAVMPVARWRTERRPTFAQSTGRRDAAAPGTGTRRRRRDRGTGLPIRASPSSREKGRKSGRSTPVTAVTAGL